MIIYSLPENVTFEKAIELAGANDKMKILELNCHYLLRPQSNKRK